MFRLAAARWLALVLPLLAAGPTLAQKPPVAPLKATGPEVTQLAAFDRLMSDFLAEHHIPGAALAVSRNGKLVYARGFGLADKQEKTPVQPTALFRIASISKPITAVAVLQLVEQGKLHLDERAVPFLKVKPFFEPLVKGKPGSEVLPAYDRRLDQITIRQLLQHTAGFDRKASFDPMFRPIVIAKAMNLPPPAGPDAIVRYVLGRRLDFDPGQRYAYSNFGYCLLGRIVEKVSGEPYEKYVQKHVLAPLGIRDMRIGKTRLGDRLPGEVTYYGGEQTVPSVVEADRPKVPPPYGAFYLEAMDAHGGWVASAVDLVRFADAFNVPAYCKVLKPTSIATMFAPPPGGVGHDAEGNPKTNYYGCGWDVTRVGAKEFDTVHAGALDGTSTLLLRRHDGLNFAVLFNTDRSAGKRPPAGLIGPLLRKTADAVTTWPDKDLYPRMVAKP